MKIFNIFKYFFLVVISLIVVFVIFFSVKYIKDKDIVANDWEMTKFTKIKDVGSIKRLSILPLIEYETKSSDLMGEPGVSYLIKADGKTILFDVGWNPKGKHPSPLLENMNKLNRSINEIDNIFISHNHPDHTGNKGIEGTFSLTGKEINLNDIIAYTPIKMNHESAKIEVINKPRKITDGIVSTGPISRAIWLMGIVEEQSLAINLEGKGIVLIVGCGHPSIDRIIKRAENIFDQPIYGVIGGLHYPITDPISLKSIGQKLIGPKLPWQKYKKSEVTETIKTMHEKNIKVVGISPHDSCNWTINQFRDRFGGGYQEIVVGTEIIIK